PDQSDTTGTGHRCTVMIPRPGRSPLLPYSTLFTSGVGTFSVTLDTAGNQTVTATDTLDNTLTGTSANIATAPAAATHFTVSAPTAATPTTPLHAPCTAVCRLMLDATGYAGTVSLTS